MFVQNGHGCCLEEGGVYMKVALPIFGSKISPRFDCATSFLIIEIEDGKIAQQTSFAIDEAGSFHRIRFLQNQNIVTILCGGIRRCDYWRLVETGMRVYAGLIGHANKIVEAFIRNELSTEPPWERCGSRGVRKGGKGGRRFGGPH